MNQEFELIAKTFQGLEEVLAQEQDFPGKYDGATDFGETESGR
jgi:hypothetical protein